MTNKELAKKIKDEHNVNVDIEHMVYTHGDIDDVYGWEPIPEEWLNEKQKMVISSDSCNGEEEQFLSWMEKNHPEINSSIENTDMGGLFEWNEEFQEWHLIADTYWDQYCNEN